MQTTRLILCIFCIITLICLIIRAEFRKKNVYQFLSCIADALLNWLNHELNTKVEQTKEIKDIDEVLEEHCDLVEKAVSIIERYSPIELIFSFRPLLPTFWFKGEDLELIRKAIEYKIECIEFELEKYK